MEEIIEGQEPQQTPEGEPEPQDGSDQQPEPEAGLTPEQIADLQKKAEVSSQNFERAKKAEAKAKELEEKLKSTSTPEGQLAPKDFLALTENKVSSEDYDEVVRVAKILNKPLNEALKDKTLKSILSERVEERKTAASTQTRSARGTTSKAPDAILDNARKGNLPEGDSDIAALVNAEVASMAKR